MPDQEPDRSSRGRKHGVGARGTRRRAAATRPLDAGPSNAGDRYHFVYAARRMLAMLAPRAAVKRIELEGVAAEDLAAGAFPDDRFVGVDLAEYEGGDDGRTARCVIITQVKYSPLHPGRPWTLARLAPAAPTPGRNVVAKLAQAFASLRDELTRVRMDGALPQIIVRLHTNQPLDSTVLDLLARAKDSVERGRSSRAQLLAGPAEDDTDMMAALRDAAQLADEEFAEFVDAWDLAAFGQPMLAEAEAALWDALQSFTSDADIRVGNLLSFVQERAIPMRRRSVRRDDVLSQLRVREQDLWPAISLFEDRDDLIHTHCCPN